MIHSKRLCLSLWTILWVLGTWRWSAIVIALLKEGQGPCLKEEVTGSETASCCSTPCSMKCAMVCATGAGPEVVVAKWTLPNLHFFPFLAQLANFSVRIADYIICVENEMKLPNWHFPRTYILFLQLSHDFGFQ